MNAGDVFNVGNFTKNASASIAPPNASPRCSSNESTPITAFSVSDCARFARLGGVANFFVEDGRLRFAVNVDAARRASLHISSRMLMLATIVKDEPASRDVRPLR